MCMCACVGVCEFVLYCVCACVLVLEYVSLCSIVYMHVGRIDNDGVLSC